MQCPTCKKDTTIAVFFPGLFVSLVTADATVPGGRAWTNAEDRPDSVDLNRIDHITCQECGHKGTAEEFGIEESN